MRTIKNFNIMQTLEVFLDTANMYHQMDTIFYESSDDYEQQYKDILYLFDKI